jgi:hypothetical protein
MVFLAGSNLFSFSIFLPQQQLRIYYEFKMD